MKLSQYLRIIAVMIVVGGILVACGLPFGRWLFDVIFIAVLFLYSIIDFKIFGE
jgi:hypothetical protein